MPGEISLSRGDTFFKWIVYLIVTITLFIVIYPIYFVLIASLSDPLEVYAGNVFFAPRGFSLIAYETIINNRNIWIGYRNTLLYTIVGTCLSVIITFMCAYGLSRLSRKNMPGRNVIMFFIIFTVFFNGGLIPTFLLVRNLNLMNTFWIMVLINMVSVFNLIVARTFLQTTIDEQLYDACYIDGCSDAKAFFTITCPLSKPIIAVLVLFYAVGQWQSFFPALIFLRDRARFPLTLILREILLLNVPASDEVIGTDLSRILLHESLKYSVIIVSSIPMLILYPFLQKYFAKGVMLGSLKG